MRIWHPDLIPYLPLQQLKGQWRELAAIKANIIKKGHPNHILVNDIVFCDYDFFKAITNLVFKTMLAKGYKPKESTRQNILKIDDAYFFGTCVVNRFTTDKYLKQCLYNLQEKYGVGGIKEEEWSIIAEKFEDYF